MDQEAQAQEERSIMSRIACSYERIAAALELGALALTRIADSLHKEPGSFTEKHSPPIPEGVIFMAKVKSFGLKKAMKAAAPDQVGMQDTVTIGGFLNDDKSPYTGADPTIVATSPDPASLLLDTPSGLVYAEHFLKAGSFDVVIVATFPDGTAVSETDTVVLTPIPTRPGSFTVTHSLPVV